MLLLSLAHGLSFLEPNMVKITAISILSTIYSWIIFWTNRALFIYTSGPSTYTSRPAYFGPYRLTRSRGCPVRQLRSLGHAQLRSLQLDWNHSLFTWSRQYHPDEARLCVLSGLCGLVSHLMWERWDIELPSGRGSSFWNSQGTKP